MLKIVLVVAIVGYAGATSPPLPPRPYKHQTPEVTTLPPAPPAGISCDPDWTHFNGSCFKVLRGESGCGEAEALCSEHGGVPASVHSNTQNDFFVDLGKKSKNLYGVCIGVRKVEKGFVNVDGTPFDYDNWSPWSNSYESELCVEILYQIGDWWDVLCENHYGNGIVCQKSANRH